MVVNYCAVVGSYVLMCGLSECECRLNVFDFVTRTWFDDSDILERVFDLKKKQLRGFDRATTDAKSRQVVNNRSVVSNLTVASALPQKVSNLTAASPLPQKVSRVRTSSATVTSPPALVSVARKRTSSGVFQVDELEPVAKKIDVKSLQKKSEVPNGRHNQAANRNNGKHEKKSRGKDKAQCKDDKLKIIHKFDSEAKSKCVSAFKESDLWD